MGEVSSVVNGEDIYQDVFLYRALSFSFFFLQAKDAGEKKADAGEKKAEGPVPTVFKIDLHCEGCAKKVRRYVRHFDGKKIRILYFYWIVSEISHANFVFPR